jgi:TatD DNase family protein
VEKIAEIKKVTIEDIERSVSLNVHRLFGIGKIEAGGKIAYKIRNSLYLNISNQCSNACVFCDRLTNPLVYGHDLKLDHIPTIEEIWEEIEKHHDYEEIVFCGYSEPLYRLKEVKEIARRIKLCSEIGGTKIRINTNGQANLIHKRNILPELKGLIDEISISLNAENAEKYQQICQSQFGEKSYPAVLEFISEAKIYIPVVITTVVDILKIDLTKCEQIARNLEVNFRVRKLNVVG